MFVLALPLHAGIIFNSFPGGVGGSYAVYGPNIIPGGATTASAFTPASNVTFDSATVAADFFGGTSAFIVDLAADSSGVPGAVLESIPVSLISGNGFTSPTTATSTLHTALTAGQQYWIILAADPSNPSGRAEWYENNAGNVGAQRFGGGGWSLGAPPVMEVDASASTAPEPGTAVMLIGAAAVLAFRARRGRFAQGGHLS